MSQVLRNPEKASDRQKKCRFELIITRISEWASVLALKFEPVLVLGGVALRPAGYAASTVWYGNHASIRGFAVIDDKVPKGTVQPSSGCHVRG
ncbi:hypothetical protein AnigIFM60653_010109 [Aspergillus niger]|uniref:Uncharacterized protein n=2 Tax=Aspergillus subgen. Circumdati TaxID=2720871 RepID=A0A3F3PXP0_9EURO|nr:hypothetical protein BDQ94DRAFT_171763 [Aspergillus welwitschiae]RDH31683.1 hypothetical protein BDQ94DRAFT_171763 [Aspergillus welwitschiae]TPR09700.1 hypothetical protein CAN33_0052780 [Aspergillus niger]GKZ73384.1 hypothetical protein AnigIFM50267_010069 [Aspergillus niger]GLA00725.1 hypothetical protein AnigIFM60653_010109 [Aspergillus niger]